MRRLPVTICVWTSGADQVPVEHGATAEILVEVSAITERGFADKLLAQSAIQIFEPGVTLRAYVSPKECKGLIFPLGAP